MKLKVDNFLKFSIALIFMRSPFFLFFISIYFFCNKKILTIFLCKIFPFLVLLLIFLLYSVFLGNELLNIFGQARDVFLCLIVFLALATVVFQKRKENKNYMFVFNIIKYFLSMIAIFKIMLLVFSAIFKFSIADILEQISEMWNIELMTMGVEDSNVTRLQLPIDSVLPFCIYFLLFELMNKKNNKKLTTIHLVLLLISLLLTFSRAFWFETILFSTLFFLLNIDLRKKIKYIFLMFVLLMGSMLIPTTRVLIFSIISSRFGEKAADINYYSDLERSIQNTYIFDKLMESPIFGNGIGYYIPNFIRSDSAKYLYESQFLSIFMNLGILGVVILLGLICYNVIYFNRLNFISRLHNIIIPLFMVLMWLLLGTTNPLLFGASGGLILFFCATYVSHYENSKI